MACTLSVVQFALAVNQLAIAVVLFEIVIAEVFM